MTQLPIPVLLRLRNLAREQTEELIFPTDDSRIRKTFPGTSRVLGLALEQVAERPGACWRWLAADPEVQEALDNSPGKSGMKQRSPCANCLFICLFLSLGFGEKHE